MAYLKRLNLLVLLCTIATAGLAGCAGEIADGDADLDGTELSVAERCRIVIEVVADADTYRACVEEAMTCADIAELAAQTGNDQLFQAAEHCFNGHVDEPRDDEGNVDQMCRALEEFAAEGDQDAVEHVINECMDRRDDDRHDDRDDDGDRQEDQPRDDETSFCDDLERRAQDAQTDAEHAELRELFERECTNAGGDDENPQGDACDFIRHRAEDGDMNDDIEAALRECEEAQDGGDADDGHTDNFCHDLEERLHQAETDAEHAELREVFERECTNNGGDQDGDQDTDPNGGNGTDDFCAAITDLLEAGFEVDEQAREIYARECAQGDGDPTDNNEGDGADNGEADGTDSGEADGTGGADDGTASDAEACVDELREAGIEDEETVRRECGL